MRLSEAGLIAIALTALGCSRAPRAVFVDLEGIVRRERIKVAPLPELTNARPVVIPAETIVLPRSPGVLILDKAEGKIDAARKLIEAARESAIRTLSRRMGNIRGEEIEAAKLKELEKLEQEHIAYLNSVYDQLFAIFEEYAQKRGPKSIREIVLEVRKPDLYASRGVATKFSEQQQQELAQVRAAIKELDADYDRRATALLDQAEVKLSGEIAALQTRFETQKANSMERAATEARRSVEKSMLSTDLNLGQNRSVRVSDIPSSTVTISGSTPKTGTIDQLSNLPIFDERAFRGSLNQQLEIWLKIQGLTLAKSRSEAIDATREFDQWRLTHRLGR